MNTTTTTTTLDLGSALQVLELEHTQESVKRAYRRLSKQRHPDSPGGSHEDFLLLRQAYNILLEACGEMQERQAMKRERERREIFREIILREREQQEKERQERERQEKERRERERQEKERRERERQERERSEKTLEINEIIMYGSVIVAAAIAVILFIIVF